MSSRIIKFMKGNAIAMIALFIALGGTASAATLAVNSVGTKQLKKNAVTTVKIKNKAVTTPKIKDAAVTGAKIAAGAVANANIAAGAVTGDKVNVATLPKVPAAANADTLGGVSNAVWGTSVRIVGIGFNPRLSTTGYATEGTGSGIYSTGAAVFGFEVPVVLPQGATATKLTLYYSNVGAADDAVGQLWFTRYDLAGAYVDLASVLPATTVVGAGSASATFSAVIDNNTYGYGLVWKSPTNVNRLMGAQVDYTMPGATHGAKASTHAATVYAGPSSAPE